MPPSDSIWASALALGVRRKVAKNRSALGSVAAESVSMQQQLLSLAAERDELVSEKRAIAAQRDDANYQLVKVERSLGAEISREQVCV